MVFRRPIFWQITTTLLLSVSTATAQTAGSTKLAGRVVDAEAKPVPGAEVYLVRGSFEPAVVATTKCDPQGKFEIASPGDMHPGSSSYDLQTYVPGKGVGAERYQASTECVIQLRPTSRVTLTMLDPDGKPVTGMKVFPRAFATQLSLVEMRQNGKPFFMRLPKLILDRLTGTTDEKGNVTLSEMPRGTRLEVGFDDERFAYPGFDKRAIISDDQEQSPQVTFQLLVGATVSGVARYGDSGKGAAGIEVVVQGTSRGFVSAGGGGFTDANGVYRIAHLSPAEYNVMLHLDESVQKDWAATGHEWVKLTGGQVTKDVDFTLIKGGIIQGKVITADTAEPIAHTGIGVHGPAHPQSSASIQRTETDTDGTYSIRVPPGLQHVYVQGPVPQAYTQPRQEIKEVKVDEGETVRMDFRLQRREGEVVNGVVIGVDGKPAADMYVRAGEETFSSSSAKTDAQGRFHFDSIPENTPLEVKSSGVATAEPVLVRKGMGEIRLQLVKRVKLDLKGLVTDEDDKPIAGARVKLGQSFGTHGVGEHDPRLTGPDGKYEIKDLYTDNHYDIGADADGFGESQAKIELGPDTRALPTLKLPRASATTGGMVVDETGKPVVGVTVHLNNGVSPKTCVTDAQGKFSFQVVPGKSHMIWVAVKEQGKVGPNVMGSGGSNDLKLVLPKDQQ